MALLRGGGLLSGEQGGDLGGVVVGHLAHGGWGLAGEGAGQGDDAGGGHTEGGGAGLGGAGEAGGDDAYRGGAAGFGDYRVVETPRCAGASIGDGVNYGVALGEEGVQLVIGMGGAVGGFAGVDHFLDAVIVEQGLP